MNTALQEIYNNKVVPDLIEKFNYKNKQEVPKLLKITINRGLGEASNNSKALDKSLEELTLISGQKPIICKSKKAIAGFKIREDIPVGITVNLRRQRMYDFLNKLINLSLPRIRDFRGISSKHFDGRGNYNLGLREQLIFPEIEYDQIDRVRGFDISIVTSANTDEESLALLQGLGMPFYN
uniref:Large ribosomal subunit protein uL5c n=1 Tax=Helminthora furcellata TaxID=1884666 RepID=A0A1G4NZJ3_9FLOR|nr:Ribosomal protein L5 [Helminthora furcellata]SCW21192.1 Ribosomal protein L5 [Helminthora furcellata]SCW24052.1 Ribosomal protein L5 [Helminthora furcellata]